MKQSLFFPLCFLCLLVYVFEQIQNDTKAGGGGYLGRRACGAIFSTHERGKRSEAHALLRSMLNDRRTHYLPMDTWVSQGQRAKQQQQSMSMGFTASISCQLTLRSLIPSLLSRAQQCRLHKGGREDLHQREGEAGREREREGYRILLVLSLTVLLQRRALLQQ